MHTRPLDTRTGTQRRSRLLPTRLLVADASHTQRDALEECIRQRFLHDYGAQVGHFHPTLLAALDPGGTVHAVAGIHAASHGPLFLEQYLDRPVQDVAKAAFGLEVTREHLVEVGNLVAVRPGGARFLFAALTEALLAAGRRWVVFTGTGPLRTMFRSLEMPFVELGAADGQRLGDELCRWGTYYQTDPRVCLFELEQLRWPLRRSLARFASTALLTESAREAASLVA